MKRYLLFLLILCLSVDAYARVVGIVTDAEGSPLIGANVWWSGTDTGTATDLNGQFQLSPVRSTKLLVTSYLGYLNDTTLVEDASKAVIIVLLSDEEQLSEISVVERKKDVVRSRYSSLDVQTIGAGELCKAACCNLSESFETSASVDVSYSDAATGAKQIRLLGLSGTYVQLLSENTPAVRGLAQSFGLEYIPGPWMESIQVSKGTSSVINGYEAISGQINVEYLKPQTQSPIAVNLLLNSELQAEANVSGGWDIPIVKDPLLGTLSTGVLAHYQEGAWAMDDNMDGFLDMPLNRNLNLLNRWYYRSDHYTFQFLVRGLHDERHGGVRDNYMLRKTGKRLPDNPYLIDLRADRVEAFMKNGFVLDETTGMSLGTIVSASYHTQRNSYGARLWDASQANAYLNIIFQNNWEGSHEDHHDHQLSAGISFNYDQYWESLLSGAKMPLDRWEVTPGIFGEYTLRLAETFSLIAGLRLDWSNRYGIFVTPRFHMRYAPFEWWTIRASAGMGYRSPNMIADNAQFLPSSRPWTVPYAGWQPAQERSVNTGLTSTWDIPLGKKTLQLTAEYYYTHFINSLVTDYEGASVNFYNLSDKNGLSYSHNAQIEASMEVLRGWTLTAAFRYNDVRQTLLNTQTGTYEVREKALQNKFKAILSTSYQTPLKDWQFDFTAQFNGPGRMPDGMKDYCLHYAPAQYYISEGKLYHQWYPQLLAQITKYWKTCSLYVGAENMSNFRQLEPIVGTRDEQGFVDGYSPDFDASMVWGPLTGWKVYVGFRWAIPPSQGGQ